MRRGDRAIRWTTTVSVMVLAAIAAVLSYKHMFVLVHRYGETSWTSALTASLAANVAVAEPSAVGRQFAAWPSCALIGSYELLMRQVRHAAALKAFVSSADPRSDDGSSDDAHRTAESASLRLVPADEFTGTADDVHTRDAVLVDRDRSGSRYRPSELQRRAWEWAITNRTQAGDLPSGKVIAERFGRRERSGRIVKQAGTAGRFDATTPAQV